MVLKKFFCHLLIIFVFLIITVFFAYPLFTGQTANTADALLHIWLISWNNHQLFSDPLNLFQANIFAPHQYTLAFSENELGLSLIAAPFIKIFHDPILAYHFLIIFGFVISGYGMYLLVYYLTGDKWLAFLAGIIYAFAPFKLAHGFERLHLTGLWLPFVFLFLHKFFQTKSWRHLWALTFFTILTAFSSLHYFVFLPFVFLTFLGFNYLNKNLDKTTWQKLIVCFLIILIFILPLVYPYFKVKELYQLERPMSEIIYYSPVLTDYFLPIFWAYKYYQYLAPHEHVVNPGFVVWLLLIISILILVRNINHLGPERQKELFIYFTMALFAFLVSFGLFLRFSYDSGFYMPGPFAYLPFLPGFDGIREPGRFSLFFLICLIVIIGFGLSKLLAQQKRWSRDMVLVILMVLLLTEFSFAKQPAEKFTDTFKLRQVPLVYNWLSEQPGDFIILELPFGWDSEFRSLDPLYVYYSIYHWKKIVNAYIGYYVPDYYQLNSDLKEFKLPKVEEWLKKYGIKYIIVHQDKYRSVAQGQKVLASLNEQAKKFKSVIRFGNDYVYEYTDK